MSLSALPEFPQLQIAKLMANFNESSNFNATGTALNISSKHESPHRKQYISNEYFINKDLEDRLGGLIKNLIESRNNGELNNNEITSVIDLFHNKVYMLEYQISMQQENMETASKESVYLKQKINHLSLEVGNYHKLYFSLHLSREKLVLENEKYQKDLKAFNEAYHNLQMKLEDQKEKYEKSINNFLIVLIL